MLAVCRVPYLATYGVKYLFFIVRCEHVFQENRSQSEPRGGLLFKSLMSEPARAKMCYKVGTEALVLQQPTRRTFLRREFVFVLRFFFNGGFIIGNDF